MADLVIRWTTNDRDKAGRIRRRFGMPRYTTVNGLTPCRIKEADMGLFEQIAGLGYYVVTDIKWQENGGVISFITR